MSPISLFQSLTSFVLADFCATLRESNKNGEKFVCIFGVAP